MNLSEIRRDIILFKDETLKIIREMSKQLFEGIRQKSNELDSRIIDIECKLSKYKESNKRMFDIILEQKGFIEKIKNLSDFKTKTETRLLEFEIKFSNFFSDLVNFKSHYDKIITENLNIPGIVGISCKYSSIADYIADNINKTKLITTEQDKIKNEISLIKKNTDNLGKSLNGLVDVSVSTSKLYVDARNNEIKNIFNKKIDTLNNLLSETKNNLQENVYNKEDVTNLIKNEIKNSKKEIINTIEGNIKKKVKIDKEVDNKDNSYKKKKDKLEKSIEIKKELKEIKKNFNDLKSSMENKLKNTLKLIKNQDNSKSSKTINNYLNSEHNTMNPNSKNNIIDNNSERQDNITILSNNNNNTESNYKALQNNETKNFNNNNNNIKKDIEDENKKENKQSNNIEENTETINSISYKVGNKSSIYKMKTPEKTLNLKSSKLNNKLKGALLNPIFLETNKQVKNIIGIDSKVKNEYNSPNIENVKHQPKYSRNDTKYKTFSENKYNFAKKFLKGNNKNNIKSESKKKLTKIFLNTKELDTEKKYVINSIKSINFKSIKEPTNNAINSENENNNSFTKDEGSLFKKNLMTENNERDRDNIAIKLIKNKKQIIDEFNSNYIKQYYPTLSLYKNYYNKKLLENKEKGQLKEDIKLPKKISPAFGRTAYTQFVKPTNKINLKKHNGNVNIIVENHLRNFIQEREYFYTLKNEKIRHKSFNNHRSKINQNEDDINNLSV